MFRFIRNLFGGARSANPVSKSSSALVAEVEKGSRGPVAGWTSPQPDPTPPVLPKSDSGSNLDGACLDLPLPPIVERMAPLLRARMNRQPTREDLVKIPLSTTLEQLPRGAVRITFRDLRLWTTPGLFVGGPGVDETLVEVPLGEVLSRLRPEQFVRRQKQKTVAVPEAVPTVFASRLSPPVANSSPAAPAKIEINRERDDAEGNRLLVSSIRSDASAPVVAIAKAVPSVPGPAIPLGPARDQPIRVLPMSVGVASPVAPAHAPATGPEPVKVSLVSVAKNWPDPIRQEIMTHHVAGFLNVPFAQLETAMRQAKPAFRWKELRSWVVPAPLATLTEQDDLLLELPLAVVTPLFMARRSSAAAPKGLAAAPEIPDLFLARKTNPPPAPAPAAPPAAVEMRPAEPSLAGVAMPAVVAASPAPIKASVAPGSPPVPSDLVRRACQLSGVSGALLVSLDGLVIASQLPAGVNAETAAAFLPRMYSRLGEYTRELKLGEPGHMEMLAGNVPVQVFKVSNAYFAILGRPAEPLPKMQLSVLAGQLLQRTH